MLYLLEANNEYKNKAQVSCSIPESRWKCVATAAIAKKNLCIYYSIFEK